MYTCVTNFRVPGLGPQKQKDLAVDRTKLGNHGSLVDSMVVEDQPSIRFSAGVVFARRGPTISPARCGLSDVTDR